MIFGLIGMASVSTAEPTPVKTASISAHDGAPISAHDGAHDFDFDVGLWRTDIVRRLDPFGRSDETMHLTGTVKVTPIWGGKGQVEEIEARGPSSHWQGMTVFLYDPKARQWSMNFANSRAGQRIVPMVGSFVGNRAELIATDTLDDRVVLVRGVWKDFTPKTHTYEESYSNDGGRIWHISFTAHKSRLGP